MKEVDHDLTRERGVFTSKLKLGDPVHFEPHKELVGRVSSIEFIEHSAVPFIAVNYWLEGDKRNGKFPETEVHLVEE